MEKRFTPCKTVFDGLEFSAYKEVGYSPEFFPTIHSTGDMAVQIVTSGPDTEHEQIKMTYLKMISLAKREILIQTPYYIPDGSIHEALKLALLSGVKSISNT